MLLPNLEGKPELVRGGRWPAASRGSWQSPGEGSPCPIPPSVPLPAGSQQRGREPEPAEPALRRLAHSLLAHYQKGTRPVRDWRTTTTVAIDLMVYAILSVDEKNQVLTTYIWYRQHWMDEFLRWDPAHFDNLTHISLPVESIWVPDILINEFVDVGKSPHVPYVYVGHHGEVQNLKPIQVMTACSLDIYNFPFDVQNCSLTFTSWLHHIRDINLSLWRQPELVKFDRSVFMNQGEWELLYVLSCFQEFSVKSSDSYAEMKFYVVIRRRPLFYTVSLLLPSIFLMVMDIVGFYLPPNSGERVSFKITLLLGYSVFLIIVSDTLPATAVGTPLIGAAALPAQPTAPRPGPGAAGALPCAETTRPLERRGQGEPGNARIEVTCSGEPGRRVQPDSGHVPPPPAKASKRAYTELPKEPAAVIQP
ncbi:5-hydroxytryptamine receptor 3A-like [Athene cunicularia]|uniref:5-hydroxytryptamine receptor 3A-like n=1 Tax=Athene cunicularia TaxID=194338 RepID=UPI000EF6B071|nr:5-hydroxytryptamine receptor 3A-like [Athene cunicularia]